jgi:hypothetical protein
MSSSPFELFRRNLKPAMVALTLLALFSFVILPAVQTYMQKKSGNRDAVVAKFGGVDLTESRVAYFTQQHYKTVQFLSELASETIKRGGTPRTAGFVYDRQNGVVQQLGINSSPSSDVSINALALAHQAEKAGFELDDTSLSGWLDAFTDGKFNDREINARLMKSSDNTMARQHLYVQLRTHLLADLFNRRGVASLASVGQGELKSPLQQWEAFLKMRRSGTFNAYGVLVNDYVEKTNSTPSESAIKKLYEEGKDRDSYEQSPLPGFHKRYQARFETLVGDYRAFINEEKGKISEDQLRAEYERRLKGGDFLIPATDEMDLDAAKAAATESTKSEEPKTDGSKTEAAKTDAAKPEESKPDSEQSQSSSTPAGDASTNPAASIDAKAQEMKAAAETSATKVDAAKPEAVAPDSAKSPDAKPEPVKPEPVKPEPVKPEPVKTEPVKTEGQSGAISKAGSVRLVAFQDEGEQKPTEPAKEESVKEEPAKEEPAKEEPAKEEPAKNEPAKIDATKEEPAKEQPKVQGFDAVKDEIATSLAMPKATARMDAAVTEITSTMKKYFTQNLIRDGSKKAESKKAGSTKEDDETSQEASGRPDLPALAKRLGFEFRSLGPLDLESVQKEDIARSTETGTMNREHGLVRGNPFAIYMFEIPGRESEVQPLLLPLRTVDDQAEKVYITWKVSEKAAYTPALDEVKEDVIKAIRFAEARTLAMADAQKLATRGQQEGKSLADLVPADRKENYFEGLGPVSAINPFGRGGVVPGNIPELDSVGEAFMESAFGAEVGGVGVAFNAPQRVVYLISPTNFEPSMDSLKEQFRQPFNRQIASMIPSGAAKVQAGFIESVQKKMSLQPVEK